ncbi:MAG: hypothetical protein M1839_001419 [Geoglossum umbratile]|nr:MAG: hypothetical protein M1839_001419 [Geoglossum umbratile]
MAPKQITLNWLEQNLWSKIPAVVFSQVPILLNVRDYLRKIEVEKLKSLPANSLTEGDVRKMFGLEHWTAKDPWSLEGREIQPVPALLTQMLAVTHHALEDAFEEAPLNEACSRVILNPILLCLISEEKTRAGQQTSSTAEPTAPLNTSAQTAPTVLAPDRPTTPIRRKELSLRFETELKCPVTYKNEHRLLSGFADYSLWYPDENGTSTNLLIVETKKLGTYETATGQLLAYMAVVHRTRKAEGKQNAVVYGMTTDSNLFRFFRLDNDSKVSRSKILEWKLGEDELICTYIRYIIRAAMASSPSTSPLKPEKAKEITLASFRTEGGTFDNNVTPYEGEDDSSELLELPDIDLSSATP